MRVLLLKVIRDKLWAVPITLERLPLDKNEFDHVFEYAQISDQAYCYEVNGDPKEIAQEFGCQLMLYEDFKTEYVSLTK